jgi:ATP-dependent DNA helicase RecQ
LIQQAQHILRNTFGYREFRHHQAAIIESILKGNDALALMPTGGGKSLCYQIPALVLDGVAIIVSPLIALMQDQVSALQQLGIRAAFINSSLDYQSSKQVEQQLLTNQLDLLYLAPERLLTSWTLDLLSRCHLALFAIDEAHCVSQWGHDFRPEYQQLSLLTQRFPTVPRIALTATADPRTQQEIIQQLHLEQADIYISSFDRPNIRYAISDGTNAKQRLWQFLENEHSQDAGIIYCLSRKKTEDTAKWLCEQGRTALVYHAGLSAQQRQVNQERFLREDQIIMVATIAFGMGIDKPDVRFVAHLNLPKSIEAYYQETGRAGRDGKPANAWMAYGLQDVIMLRQFTDSSNASDQQKRIERNKLDAMLSLCELIKCRRQAILHYFGEALAEPCGNCDNCQIPPETWDATVAAQKALSCVYRTGQRFGVNYVVEVLVGKDDDRIRRFGHDQLSTYGLGKELPQTQWRTLFRQLIAHAYLSVDVDNYGALQLTEKSRSLLRSEETLQLRKQIKSKKVKKKAARSQTVNKADQPLWDELKHLRFELAQEQSVPPYVIFHDATLQQMISKRPNSLDEMQNISGIGKQKLNHYGQVFLDVLLQYPRDALFDNTLSETINDTLYYHSQGMDASSIAAKRDLTFGTVLSHFAEAIELGLAEPRDVLDITQSEHEDILNALELHNTLEEGRLKPVFDELEGHYDYGILRCILAGI